MGSVGVRHRDAARRSGAECGGLRRAAATGRLVGARARLVGANDVGIDASALRWLGVLIMSANALILGVERGRAREY